MAGDEIDEMIIHSSPAGFELIHNPSHNFVSPKNVSRMDEWTFVLVFVCVHVCVHVWLMDNVVSAGELRSVAINYNMLLSGSCHVAQPYVKAHFPPASSRGQRMARKHCSPDRNSYVEIAGGAESMRLTLNKVRVKLWGERPPISWKTCITGAMCWEASSWIPPQWG